MFMRSAVFLLIAITFSAGCAHRPLDRNDARARQAEWRLVWSDEFDKPGPPDPKNWVYQLGFKRPSEAQLYTSRTQNVRVENGMLVLETRKEAVRNGKYRRGSKSFASSREFSEYTGGGLTTKGKHAWQYGRFEARIRQPEGIGAWTAFWTVGVKGHWPANGEIDIMEWWGKNPSSTTANAHYEVNKEHLYQQGRLTVGNPSADFHIYALEWTPQRLDFFYDDRKFHTFEIDKARNGDFNPYHQPAFLLFISVIDGRPRVKVDPSRLPQKFLVDYVRIYQRP